MDAISLRRLSTLAHYYMTLIDIAKRCKNTFNLSYIGTFARFERTVILMPL